VPVSGYPFEMAGGVPVVTAPAEIDTSTAGELRAILCEWRARGYTTVVVDLTGTEFCDLAGLRELVWAHQRAVADSGGLRLVTAAGGTFLRVFTVTGVNGIIPRFATVKQALARLPAAASHTSLRGSAPGPAAAPASSPALMREHGGRAAARRHCEQCGAVFVPAREHARFCSVDCRAGWNREHLGDPAVNASALTWSIAAMSEATGRLPAVRVWDQAQAIAAIGEAVWWITMVDATLVRHHPKSYGTVMAARTPAERQLISQTLAGLRFVRNWIGRAAGPGDLLDTGTGTRRITHWAWKPTSEPALVWLPPRAQAWEQARYRAYQARLAGHTIGQSFSQAVRFLTFTATSTASTTPHTSRRATPSPHSSANQATADRTGDDRTM
jgi:anti-sigma B factor antagonist